MKRIKNFLKKEMDYLFVWGQANRYRLIAFLAIIVFLIFLSFAPYFNLILTKTFLAFLVFSVASFIFNIESSKLIFLGILLLLPAFLFYFFEEFNTAEMIGNFIYGIFLLGTLKGILSRK